MRTDAADLHAFICRSNSDQFSSGFSRIIPLLKIYLTYVKLHVHPVRDFRFACTLRKSDDDTPVLKVEKGQLTSRSNSGSKPASLRWKNTVASGYDEDEGIGGLLLFFSVRRAHARESGEGETAIPNGERRDRTAP